MPADESTLRPIGSNVHRANFRRLTDRQRAAIMLAQVRNLLALRARLQLASCANDSLWILALALASAPEGRLQRNGHWPGLSEPDLLSIARQHGIEDVSPTEINSIFQGVTRWQQKHGVRLPAGEYIGAVLQVTAAEREEARAWQIVAVDESRAERAVRQKKVKTARRREERDRQPRTAWLAANDASRTKPWEMFNISRRTWYRLTTEQRSDRLAQVCHLHKIDVQKEVTHLCHRDLDLDGQDLPSIHFREKALK